MFPDIIFVMEIDLVWLQCGWTSLLPRCEHVEFFRSEPARSRAPTTVETRPKHIDRHSNSDEDGSHMVLKWLDVGCCRETSMSSFPFRAGEVVCDVKVGGGDQTSSATLSKP